MVTIFLNLSCVAPTIIIHSAGSLQVLCVCVLFFIFYVKTNEIKGEVLGFIITPADDSKRLIPGGWYLTIFFPTSEISSVVRYLAFRENEPESSQRKIKIILAHLTTTTQKVILSQLTTTTTTAANNAITTNNDATATVAGLAARYHYQAV